MLLWCKDFAKTNHIKKESFMKSPDLEGWRPFSLGGALVFYGVWWLWCFWWQAKRQVVVQSFSHSSIAEAEWCALRCKNGNMFIDVYIIGIRTAVYIDCFKSAYLPFVRLYEPWSSRWTALKKTCLLRERCRRKCANHTEALTLVESWWALSQLHEPISSQLFEVQSLHKIRNQQPLLMLPYVSIYLPLPHTAKCLLYV